MELGNELFFWCGELIFALTREKKFGLLFRAFARKKNLRCFLGCFFVLLCFGGGDFVLLGFFFFFRAQRDFFFELIFRNGAEQNGGMPLWNK